MLVHTLHRPTWAAAAVPPASAPEDAPAFAEACGGGGPAPPPLPFVWFVQNAVPAVGGPQDPGDPNVPGSRVRQQTLDVVELLQVAFAIASLPSSDGATWGGDREAYYMFQVCVCSHALLRQHLRQRVSRCYGAPRRRTTSACVPAVLTHSRTA